MGTQNMQKNKKCKKCNKNCKKCNKICKICKKNTHNIQKICTRPLCKKICKICKTNCQKCKSFSNMQKIMQIMYRGLCSCRRARPGERRPRPQWPWTECHESDSDTKRYRRRPTPRPGPPGYACRRRTRQITRRSLAAGHDPGLSAGRRGIRVRAESASLRPRLSAET